MLLRFFSSPTLRRAPLASGCVVGVGVGVGLFIYARHRRLLSTASAKPAFTAPPKHLLVVNPRDGSEYNAEIVQCLREIFHAVHANVTLEEFDVGSKRVAEILPLLGNFDGIILPGSAASVAAGAYTGQDAPDWIRPLESLIRNLHAKRKPMLGICFGHQIMATALGGRVEANAEHGLQAAECSFDLTPLGTEVLLSPAEAATAGAGRPLGLHYHHNDVVSRLPTCAANLGCSRANPAHAAAYFTTATVARTAVTRGSLPASEDQRPRAVTFQAHPEFCTPTGRRILVNLLKGEGPKFGAAWLEERLATVESGSAEAASRGLVTAAVRLLWPDALGCDG